MSTAIKNQLAAVLESTPTRGKPRTRAYHREMNARFKALERTKNASWQRGADGWKKTLRKKGVGRAVKYKGEVMPTVISNNSFNQKSWARLGYYGESMKFLYLYSVT